jgi:cation-transporting ATPase 13A3/4/5
LCSGQPRDSTELVPGDIVTLIDPTVSVFPADFLLLSGDAIVNESMLTGESVPVSKVPIKDQDLVSWRETREVSHESAKGFLYAGTRVIRVRGALVANGTNTGPCLAMVARTGMFLTERSP